MNQLNIVFAGTPEFALPCLEAIKQSGHDLQAIYTQPDRSAGRGLKLQASPVKQWALAHGTPVYQPVNFKNEAAVEELAALKPDILVVIAYGLILPPAVLSIPRLGCVNVHASLLPRWRGASPIQQALLAGDEQTGITIMQMDAGMDTGDILATASCSINPRDTAGSLHDRLAQLAVKPLLTTLSALACGQISRQAQDNNKATYAPKIKKENALINWSQTARQIDRQIRAFNPWPIAYTSAQGELIRIYQAQVVSTSSTETPGTILSLTKEGMLVATKEQALLIDTLQFSGGKIMTVADWLNAGRSQQYSHLVLQ